MNANIADLRYRMKDVLRAIDRGETVTILYRGNKRAKLIPIASASGTKGGGRPSVEDQPLFGLWSDREDMANPSAIVRNLRRPRHGAR